MPCDSKYLEASEREKEIQRAAKLLIYVLEKIGRKPAKWIVKESNNYYAKDDRAVTQLCAILKSMKPRDRDAIVYNARDKVARDLADWWEDHQAADAEREAEEAKQKRLQKVRKGALSKLTKEEREALEL